MVHPVIHAAKRLRVNEWPKEKENIEPSSTRACSSDTPAQMNLDKLIADLTALKEHPVGTLMKFNEADFAILSSAARLVMASQPAHLELGAPLKIAGDIHGQYHDLLRLFHIGGSPPTTNYLFLGDYVDRGQQSLETIALLLAYKIKFADNFFLLRGNHESRTISRVYGFYDECKRRYSPKVWMLFTSVFAAMPYTARIEDRILCMHGGLSPELTSISQLTELRALCGPVPREGLLCDLLWSDPLPGSSGWLPNDRNISVTFGADVVHEFCRENDIDLIVRAHQVVEDGFEFFAKRKLVTVFSVPNYCQEFDNAAALLDISETLECSFSVWKSIGFLEELKDKTRLQALQNQEMLAKWAAKGKGKGLKGLKGKGKGKKGKKGKLR